MHETTVRSDNKRHNLNNRIPHNTENSNCNTVSRTLLIFQKKKLKKINDREESTHGRAV